MLKRVDRSPADQGAPGVAQDGSQSISSIRKDPENPKTYFGWTKELVTYITYHISNLACLLLLQIEVLVINNCYHSTLKIPLASFSEFLLPSKLRLTNTMPRKKRKGMRLNRLVISRDFVGWVP